MALFIGADLGTSALKLLLLDEKGVILKTVSKSYELSFPHPLWSEESPEDWLEAFYLGFEELVDGYDRRQVRGIGAGGQMHGLVVLDENDEVIRPAILWNDGRCEKQVDYLNNIVGKDTLIAETGNIAFAGFTLPKLLWMRENERENFDRIRKVMLPKDYLNYKLTGVHSTDYSDASGMLLLDCRNKRWSSRMVELAGISEDMLPRLFESYEKVGCVRKEVAGRLGLGNDVAVAAGAGDNAAAALGTGTIGDARCNISLGTSGTLFFSSNSFFQDDKASLHSFCHADGRFHLMGCMLSAGSANKWWMDEILKSSMYKEEESLIREEKLGRNHVFFLPYLMGERSPINDTDVRGTFIGLSMDTTRQDMLQAVLEGVAFALKDSLEVAREFGLEITRSTVCGGGSRSALWLRMIADILDIKLDIPLIEEGPGLGGALLAMVASGDKSSIDDAVKLFTAIKRTVEPEEDLVNLYKDRYEKFKRIYPGVKKLYKEIKE